MQSKNQISNTNDSIMSKISEIESKIKINQSNARYKKENAFVSISSSKFSNYSSSSFDISPEQSVGKERKAEMSVWRGVILQAIIDSVSEAKRVETQKAREEAIKWLNITNEDFKMACQLAGFAPSYVLERTKFAIKNVNQWKKSCRDLKIDKSSKYLEDPIFVGLSGNL